MTITRRAVLSGLGAAAGTAFVRPLRAQPAFPAGVGTIKIVIPFAPGGGSDIIGRLLADGLTKRWGVPAVIEHVPGASATVGVARVAQGPADGSQILILNILYVTTDPHVRIVLSAGARHRSARLSHTATQSLLREKGSSGQLGCGIYRPCKGTARQTQLCVLGRRIAAALSAELFQYMTGTRMTHIPYSGSAPSQNALAGGHVHALFDNAAAIVGLARSGAVKPLAITTPSCFRLAPEFPAIADACPATPPTGGSASPSARERRYTSRARSRRRASMWSATRPPSNDSQRFFRKRSARGRTTSRNSSTRSGSDGDLLSKSSSSERDDRLAHAAVKSYRLRSIRILR